MIQENLVLYLDNPLATFEPHDGYLGEALPVLFTARCMLIWLLTQQGNCCVPLVHTLMLPNSILWIISQWNHIHLLKHCCHADVWKPFGYVQPLNYKMNSTECQLSAVQKYVSCSVVCHDEWPKENPNRRGHQTLQCPNLSVW